MQPTGHPIFRPHRPRATRSLMLAVMMALLTFGAGVLTPAPAFAYEGAAITSPAQGSSVQGPVTSFTIDMGTHPAGTYNVSAYGCKNCYPQSPYYETFSFDYDPTTGSTKTIPLPTPMTITTNHSLNVTRQDADTYWNVASSAFVVARPIAAPEAILDVYDRTIFPYKRDGYLDKAHILWVADGDNLNGAWLEILNSSGAAVVRRQVPAGEWGWRGRRDDGSLVPVGTYTVRLTAANSLGQTDVAEETIRVAHRRVWSIVETTRKGTQTSARREGPGCQAASGNGVLHMDCVGGTRVDAFYSFNLPRKTRNVRVSIYGSEDTGTRGDVQFTYTRPSATRVLARIRVTGSRAYIAESVTLTYTARVMR